ELAVRLGQAVSGPGDRVVEPGDLPFVDGHDVPHHRKAGAEPLEAAQFGAPIGAGAGFDGGADLVAEAPDGFPVLSPVELGPQRLGGRQFGGGAPHDSGEHLDRRGRGPVAVAGGGGVGDDADPVVVPTSAHPDVEVLAGGGAVGEEHSAIDGDALGLVDGEGVGQGDVLGGVAGRQDDPAPSVEVGDDEGAVVPAGVDV